MNSVGAIIAAAGDGRRMNGHVPKQFADLGGKPVVMHSLLKFQRHPQIALIVLVVAKEFVRLCEKLNNAYGITKAVIAIGGSDRQASVFNGLQATDECEIVLVHDAARPFVNDVTITEIIKAAKQAGAAAPAVPAVDTVKFHEEGKIVTLDRKKVVLIQTPQGFRREILAAAHQNAALVGFKGPDDCALVEQIGITPKIISGSRENFKITHSLDLELAKLVLERT